MNDERVALSEEQAIAMLPDGDEIHTFSNPAPSVLVGADWSRTDIIEAIKQHGAELSGEQATQMGHGMVLADQRLFIATKKT